MVLPPLTLDNPAWAALTGPHAHLAEVRGRAARYPVDVSPFVALPDLTDASAWADLADLAGPGARLLVTGAEVQVPPAWEVEFQGIGVQLIGSSLTATAPDPEIEPLGVDDVPEMLELVARTKPGPFAPRTIEMGGYLGIRRGGVLVAMAGERMRLPGWTEISAVCTDESQRGQGLGSRLVRAVATGILRRGETPFLHAVDTNSTAISLYGTLGFTMRRKTNFIGVLVPGPPRVA